MPLINVVIVKIGNGEIDNWSETKNKDIGSSGIFCLPRLDHSSRYPIVSFSSSVFHFRTIVKFLNLVFALFFTDLLICTFLACPKRCAASI